MRLGRIVRSISWALILLSPVLIGCDRGGTGSHVENVDPTPSVPDTPDLSTTPSTASTVPLAAATESRSTVLEQPSDEQEDLWTLLAKRPIDLPSLDAAEPCPATAIHDRDGTPVLGSGPVFALGALSLPSESRSFESNIEAFGGDSAVYKVPWQLDDRNYDGVILIRGRQLDGDHVVLFQREDVSEELRLTPGASDARTPDGEWWTSSMLIPAPGCYAIQIDGLDFADTIIFEIKE